MAFKDLMFFIFFLIIVWFIWFVFGGPERYNPKEGPFIRPLPPVDTGETYWR